MDDPQSDTYDSLLAYDWPHIVPRLNLYDLGQTVWNVMCIQILLKKHWKGYRGLKYAIIIDWYASQSEKSEPNKMGLKQNGWQFTDDIFIFICLKWKLF